MKNKKLLMVSFALALTLAACNKEDGNKDTEQPIEQGVQLSETTSIGFVTYIEKNEYVEIELEGVKLRYETETENIEIGDKVKVTYSGEIEELNNVQIEFYEKDATSESDETEVDKKGDEPTGKPSPIIYIDKNGNMMTAEQLKQREEEKKRQAELEKEKEREAQAQREAAEKEAAEKEKADAEKPVSEEPDKEVVTEEPKNPNTNPEAPAKPQTKSSSVVILGKADNHSVELIINDQIAVFNFYDKNVGSALDTFDFEQPATISYYQDANGKQIITKIVKQ